MPRRYLASLLLACFVSPVLAQDLEHEKSDTTVETLPDQLKTLNDHFPFEVPDSVQQWNDRSQALRRRVLVATGLWPMPTKTELDPVFHGKVQRDGFTMEKVYFQSLPGHYVSAMLFRPSPENQNALRNGKRPGILSPHGHGGRTQRLSDDEMKRQLESGSEVFEQSGRYPKLARCAHLARMGCVTLIFDMLGYADSQQISYKVAHRHADPRPEESDSDRPCFFSIDADLNLQSIMGLQTWNAIRALELLESLPEVDPERLGVTGGSGGGTQTILLGAIDPRVKVSFPNGMVSTSMQGGCYCENCNYLRIGTGNVELAALFAPKPQGMTAANDWTKDMLTDGFPELQTLYSMLGKPHNVMCGDVLRFPHNYNYVTRSMMYPWMAKHLGLPPETPLVERDFETFTESEMSVWNDQHPAPSETGVPHERNVLAWWKKQSDRALGRVLPKSSKADLTKYREVIGGAWSVFFDRELPTKDQLVITKIDRKSDAEIPSVAYSISHPKWGTEFEVTVIHPGSSGEKPVVVLAADPARVADYDSKTTYVRVPFDTTLEHQPVIADSRSYSGFTFGYNRPLVVRRFEKLLCAIAAFQQKSDQPIAVHAVGDLVAPAAAAAWVAGERVGDVVIRPNGFRFGSVQEYKDENFLPGAVKYFDLPGLLSLRAPLPMTILGEDNESLSLVESVYAASDSRDQLTTR